ncbi:hypothetical protein, partial [Mesotoga prima]|uniref:hypothetical protein n=1 Tax=Mesotoga prima TaxID=1184387 RepID=UPI002FDAEBA7
MYVLKQNTANDGIAVISSSITNRELISFLCYRSNSISIAAAPVSQVPFPNILATLTLHEDTDAPLFYKMDIPGFSFASNDELYASISITAYNGANVGRENYMLIGDENTISIYTNLRGAYFVHYTPYPHSGLGRTSSFLLSVTPSLVEGVDYSVSASGGYYHLSKSVFVTNDTDREDVLTMLYSSDENSPWYVHVNPMNLNGVQINKENNSYTINSIARKVYENLFVVDAKNISAISSDDHTIISFNNDGYLVIDTDEDNIEVEVEITTDKPIIKENDIPIDFRPHVFGCKENTIKYNTKACINEEGYTIGNVITSYPGEGSY